ncbi:T9SS type A sorting domain-containing protein, partial [Spirosoma flavum]
YGTVSCSWTLVNSANGVLDTRLDRVAHSSVGTADCSPQHTGYLSQLTEKAYPNPVTTELHVRPFIAGARIMIYSMLGGLLLESRTGSTESSLNVQFLPAGNYFLVISLDKELQITQPFVKHN